MWTTWMLGCSEGSAPVDAAAGAESLQYTDVATEWGLVDTTDDEPYPRVGSGVTIADLDEDGLDDVILALRTGDTWIHWSRGDHFELEPLGLDLLSNCTGAIDVDGDRHLDLLVTGFRNTADNRIYLLRGDGAGGFSAPETSAEALPPGHGDVLGIDGADVDGDGDVDLYVTHVGDDDLLLNDGTGRFTAASTPDLEGWTDTSWLALWLDANGDSAPDLLVANDMQADHEPSRVYRNEGGGAFTEVAAPATVNAMGASLLDYDGDGREDAFITGTGGDGLYQNRGDGTWVDVSVASGARGTLTLGQMHLGSVAADFDNDGWIDIASAGGRSAPDDALLSVQDPYEPDSLLRNEGGTFVEIGRESGLVDDGDSRAIVAGDLNGDGTLEVIVTVLGSPSHVFHAPRLGARSLDIELTGHRSNAFGLGARIELAAGGRTRTQWMSNHTGLVGGGPLRAHFGLGEDSVESVVVHWPSGIVQAVPVEPDIEGRLLVVEAE